MLFLKNHTQNVVNELFKIEYISGTIVKLLYSLFLLHTKLKAL